MKKIGKKITVLLMAIFMLLPVAVFAEEEQLKGNATSIQQACAEEQIAFDHEDYKNNQEGKINIYLFRGNGCSHCHEFLEYLETIIDDYGKYFNVITYEVWSDSDNGKLMEKVAEKLGEEASGVPYIIIGEKTFAGYSSSMNEEIETLIKEEYEKEERYDVMKELGVDTKVSDEKVENSAEKNTSDVIILVIALVIVGGIITFAVMARKQN